MNRKSITVYVADHCDENRELTCQLIKLSSDITVVGHSGSGEKAAKEVLALNPDVLLTDSVLPEKDGFALVRAVRDAMGQKGPAAVMLSDYYSPAIMREVAALGISYFLLKPVLEARLTETIRNAAAEREENYIGTDRLMAEITDILRDMGIPASLRGYQFIREAIYISVRDPGVLNYVTKELYPAVARVYQTTPEKVERAMRHAIEISWDRGDLDSIHRIFGYTVSGIKGKPTNSEFVAMIADHLALKHGFFRGSKVCGMEF